MENQAQKPVQQPEPLATEAAARTNEKGQILVDGVLRISDPNTKEVFVEVRA